MKAKKAAKIASLAAEASEMTRKAGNTLDTISDTMKAASKWGDNPLKLADGITAEAGSKAMKALETGGDFAKESNKAVWEMKAVVGADGVKLSTSADTSASLFKNGFAKTDGVAKSAKKVGKSGKSTELVVYDPEFATRQLLDGGTTSEEIISLSTLPGPTEGSWFTSPTIII
mgnify:CR=1 FL=1